MNIIEYVVIGIFGYIMGKIWILIDRNEAKVKYKKNPSAGAWNRWF